MDIEYDGDYGGTYNPYSYKQEVLAAYAAKQEVERLKNLRDNRKVLKLKLSKIKENGK